MVSTCLRGVVESVMFSLWAWYLVLSYWQDVRKYYVIRFPTGDFNRCDAL